MSDHPSTSIRGVVVEDEVQLTLDQLGRACHVQRSQLVALVEEGVLEPTGGGPQEWRFAGPSLRRARAALRLARDFELSPAGTAVILELLDQIAELRSRLTRAGLR